MYKLIEIETTNQYNITNNYIIEIVNFKEDRTAATTFKIYREVHPAAGITEKITSFKATFKTGKKILNQCLLNYLNGVIVSITEY